MDNQEKGYFFRRRTDIAPLRDLIFLMVYCIAGLSLTSLFAIAYSVFFMGYSMAELQQFTLDPSLPGALSVLRMSQVFSSIGVFVIPPLLFMRIRGINLFSRSNRSISQLLFGSFFCGLLMMTQLPLINFLAEWNGSLVLPDAFHALEVWMKQQETQAERMTEVFLTMSNPSDGLITLLIMALIPAVGEELLFRGALQPIIKRLTGNKHLAVWITAFVFSFIHFQFYGFIPRFLLGAFLGYLFLWGKSILFPMAAHFANNAMAVSLTYADQHSILKFPPEEAGTGETAWLQVMISLILLFTGCWLFKTKIVADSSPV